MKLRAEAEMEIICEAILTDLKIGDRKYKLEVRQSGCDGDHLDLVFIDAKSEGHYTVHIDERGLRLHREVMRPNHDHNDYQDMRITPTGRDAIGVPSFDPGYFKGDRALAWFEFGPTKVDY